MKRYALAAASCLLIGALVVFVIRASSSSDDVSSDLLSADTAPDALENLDSSETTMPGDETSAEVGGTGSELGIGDEPGEQAGDVSVVVGRDATKPFASWAKPALGSSYQDPAYGTNVTRVSDSTSDRFNRNTYSRRQAENADGTMYLTYHGSSKYHVYESSALNLVRALDIHPDGEPQWHPDNPNVIRHIAGPNSSTGAMKLFETNVKTNQTRELADLTERIKTSLPDAHYMYDRAEGSPSADGNRFAWMVYDKAEQPIGIVSYDLRLDRVLGTSRVPSSQKVDWVSASPSGDYVVASSNEGTFVFDADLTNRRLLTEAIEHSDIGYDKDGREVYVYSDFNSASATDGWLTSVDMKTLQRTKVFNIYDNANTSMHISMKGYGKPGWALVSTYNCKDAGAWSCDKIFAVELQPNGKVVNLAHTYNCGEDYWTETQAVVNRSFTQVYFNSDAGSCKIDAEVYRIDVPAFS